MVPSPSATSSRGDAPMSPTSLQSGQTQWSEARASESVISMHHQSTTKTLGAFMNGPPRDPSPPSPRSPKTPQSTSRGAGTKGPSPAGSSVGALTSGQEPVEGFAQRLALLERKQERYEKEVKDSIAQLKHRMDSLEWRTEQRFEYMSARNENDEQKFKRLARAALAETMQDRDEEVFVRQFELKELMNAVDAKLSKERDRAEEELKRVLREAEKKAELHGAALSSGARDAWQQVDGAAVSSPSSGLASPAGSCGSGSRDGLEAARGLTRPAPRQPGSAPSRRVDFPGAPMAAPPPRSSGPAKATTLMQERSVTFAESEAEPLIAPLPTSKSTSQASTSGPLDVSREIGTLREEVGEIQELVQDWAARQRTLEKRVTTVETSLSLNTGASSLIPRSPDTRRPMFCC
eukprot:TRINITY_DN31312_c0_g1_i1.p1 TRINITY_DN31312_c0_g1~~TRINITY_DN31312_c0_g1_i1.p1  ORF type:complete len:466 (-),score=91.54 TRINITY_DN31312_c0_g1_i1:168-1385(-)